MGSRVRQVIIRCTPDELGKIDAEAKRRSMRRATFIRETVIHGMPPTIPEINRIALDELHRIGSNLNQIARAINTTGNTHCVNFDGLDDQLSALRLILLGAA